jgi:hypothetical protein
MAASLLVEPIKRPLLVTLSSPPETRSVPRKEALELLVLRLPTDQMPLTI